jgi:hypothetical protein
VGEAAIPGNSACGQASYGTAPSFNLHPFPGWPTHGRTTGRQNLRPGDRAPTERVRPCPRMVCPVMSRYVIPVGAHSVGEAAIPGNSACGQASYETAPSFNLHPFQGWPTPGRTTGRQNLRPGDRAPTERVRPCPRMVCPVMSRYVIPVGAHSVGEAADSRAIRLGTGLLRNRAIIQPSSFPGVSPLRGRSPGPRGLRPGDRAPTKPQHPAPRRSPLRGRSSDSGQFGLRTGLLRNRAIIQPSSFPGVAHSWANHRAPESSPWGQGSYGTGPSIPREWCAR